MFKKIFKKNSDRFEVSGESQGCFKNKISHKVANSGIKGRYMFDPYASYGSLIYPTSVNSTYSGESSEIRGYVRVYMAI